MSLIVCRSIGDSGVVASAWISALALVRTYASFVRPKAGARRIMPIAPVSTAPMSAISNVGSGTRQLRLSKSWQSHWELSQAGLWIERLVLRLRTVLGVAPSSETGYGRTDSTPWRWLGPSSGEAVHAPAIGLRHPVSFALRPHLAFQRNHLARLGRLAGREPDSQCRFHIGS